MISTDFIKDKILSTKVKEIELISPTSIFKIKVKEMSFEGDILIVEGKTHSGKGTFKFNLQSVVELDNINEKEFKLVSHYLYSYDSNNNGERLYFRTKPKTA